MVDNNQIEKMARVAIESLPIFNAKNYNTVYKMCEALYNAGFRREDWTSLEEGLPDVNTDVLVCQGNCLRQSMYVYTYLGDNKWEDEYGYRHTTDSALITHWQPRPRPPKMKGTE